MDTSNFVILAILVIGIAIIGGFTWRGRSKAQVAKRAQFIQRYSFPAELRNRLQRNHDLTLEGSGRVLEGLRQYFLACLAAQRRPIAKEVGMPSMAVDAAWHEFIVLTREYASFCEKAFGRYLHHTPKAMMQERTQSALANTLHQFKQPALTPAGWAMVGSVPLLFALDRELGFKDGHIYDERAIHELEAQRQMQVASASSSGGGDAGSSYSWSGGPDKSDSSPGVGDGGGGSCGGGGCGGS